MTFPGLLNFLPPKIPPGAPWVRVGQICLGSNQSHIHPNMCAKFGCGPTGVNAMLVWQSRNEQKLRHPATLATIFLEHPSLGSLVVRLITGDPIGISGVKYLCVAIRSLIQLWMIICVVTVWNVCVRFSHTVRWQRTHAICRTMRRRECKLFITSVTCRLSPNQWIILLTMLIFNRHLWMYPPAVTTPGTPRLLLAHRDYSWHGTTPAMPVESRSFPAGAGGLPTAGRSNNPAEHAQLGTDTCTKKWGAHCRGKMNESSVDVWVVCVCVVQ